MSAVLVVFLLMGLLVMALLAVAIVWAQGKREAASLLALSRRSPRVRTWLGTMLIAIAAVTLALICVIMSRQIQ